MLRYLTAGESHGMCLSVILDGLPSNFDIDEKNINDELRKRQGGYGRGDRMKIETDKAVITSGIRGFKTIGSPISIQIKNKDYENWKEYMNPCENVDRKTRKITKARPGHADLTGCMKFDFDDVRNVLERASARETAVHVAVGAICKQFLKNFNIDFISHVVQIGSVKSNDKVSFEYIKENVDKFEIRCVSNDMQKKCIDEIKKAKDKGDTLGGVFEIRIKNVPPGIGSYTQYDKKIDANLAFSLMAVQAIKGVEFGLGFECAGQYGSSVHDEVFYSQDRGIYRKTNNCGGIEGGMSNGEQIIIRCAMKPIPTLYKPLNSIDINSFENYKASIERSDACAVSAASVVGENIAAFVIAKLFLDKFGCDNMKDISSSFENYIERLGESGWIGV